MCLKKREKLSRTTSLFYLFKAKYIHAFERNDNLNILSREKIAIFTEIMKLCRTTIKTLAWNFLAV